MRRAFTLIELLAAMVVFALVVLVGAALVNSASGVTRATVQRTTLREEARSVFDRMALDISTAIYFETYQMQTPSGTNGGFSILSRCDRAGGMRLQRIDYHVTSNGLFRSVHEVGWNDSQDLASIAESSGELLSPSVGQMIVQSLFNDGSTQATLSTPRVHATPSAVGVRVGLVLAPNAVRKARSLALPAAVTTNGNPWIVLGSDDEQKGWRVSEKVFRFP